MISWNLFSISHFSKYWDPTQVVGLTLECYRQQSHLEASYVFPLTWTSTKANAILDFVRKDLNHESGESTAGSIRDAFSKCGSFPSPHLTCWPLSCISLGSSDALVTFCVTAVVSASFFDGVYKVLSFVHISFLIFFIATCFTTTPPQIDGHLLVTPSLDLLTSFL